MDVSLYQEGQGPISVIGGVFWGIILIVIGVYCLSLSVNSGIYIVLGIALIGWGIKIIAERKQNMVPPEVVKNQEELMQTAFSLAEKYGGIWRISFTSTEVIIYLGEEYDYGNRQCFQLEKLGYNKLNLEGGFLPRLKQAAESKGYLFWKEMGYFSVQGDSYTSYDGGHSYSRDHDSGNYVKSANVCTADYYRKFKPYSIDPGHPLKKL